MATKVRVPKTALALGGWKGQLTIDGNVLRVVGDDSNKKLDIDCAQVKRCSSNSNNGLWAMRMEDGTKLYLQTSGMILSADRSSESRAATDRIAQLLAENGVRGWKV